MALGSVKSNIGHLRPAAGAAGLLKATLALHEKLIPASLGFERPRPNIDWASSPLRVNTQTRPWDAVNGRARCAAVSAFGFGGTNFTWCWKSMCRAAVRTGRRLAARSACRRAPGYE